MSQEAQRKVNVKHDETEEKKNLLLPSPSC